jgi:hypothetical protein
MTKQELRDELKRIESDVCRLSLRVLDQDHRYGSMLVRVGEVLLVLYEAADETFKEQADGVEQLGHTSN